MYNHQLTDWEGAAKAAAAELRASLMSSVPADITIEAGLGDEQNGTNSLCVPFLQSLSDGAHLNDDFLAGV